MGLINHLKNRDAQNNVLAIASGLHTADGHLCYSYTSGTSPVHNIFIRHALGDSRSGRWNAVKSVYFRGLNIPSTDYEFFNGNQITSSTFFPTDIPHYRTPMLNVKCPTGVGEADTSASVPDGLAAIIETGCFPDFDAAGNQVVPGTSTIVGSPTDALVESDTNFTYTTNPARVFAGWYLTYCRFASRSDINWVKWTAWRDYLGTTETVDYTTLPNFDGFGLTGSYYSGTSFNTFITKRVDPSINFVSSTGAPAPGLPTDGFSVRWEGKIKPLYSETYTFKAQHDDGVKVYVNNMSVPIIDQWVNGAATHTATIALTADQFYDIKVEWYDNTSAAEMILKWSSASQTEEVIRPEQLYPKAETREKYAAHIAFSFPTTPDQMISTVLFASNSIVQNVDGKMEFYCIEQLTSSATITETDGKIMDGILTRISRTDRKINPGTNVFEAKFRSVDSGYLEEPPTPLILEIPELIASAGGKKYVTVVDFTSGGFSYETNGFKVSIPRCTINLNHWQTRKILRRLANEEINDLTVDFEGRALSSSIIPWDITTMTHSAGNFILKDFYAVETNDKSPLLNADTRTIRLKEWNPNAIT